MNRFNIFINGSTSELVLTSDLDDCYLTGDDFTDIDPITIRNKKKNIELYEKNVFSVLLVDKDIYYKFKSKTLSYLNFKDVF